MTYRKDCFCKYSKEEQDAHEKAFRENYAVEVYHENNKTCIGTAVAILTLSAPALTCLYMVAAGHANIGISPSEISTIFKFTTIGTFVEFPLIASFLHVILRDDERTDLYFEGRDIVKQQKQIKKLNKKKIIKPKKPVMECFKQI